MVLTSVSASAKQRVPMQGSSLTSQFIITIINELPPLFESAVKLSQGVSLVPVADDLEDTAVYRNCPQRYHYLGIVRRITQLNEKQKELKDLMSSDKLGMLPELHSRIAVLRNLLYVDNQDLVTLKGRCCCLVGEGRKFYCSYGQEMLCC